MNKLSAIIFCILIASCGSASVRLSDTHLMAVEFNQKAEHAFGRGDYKEALDFYNEALRINRSIENTDGIAINLINIATVYRRISDKDNSHKYVDEVLNASGIMYLPLRLSQATLIKAMLYMEDAQYDTASQWASKSLSLCRDAKCTEEGRIYNINAKIALLKGDPGSSLSYAMKGLELNKGHNDLEETANSLRFIADAETARNNYDAAIRFYEDALVIDKARGLSRKVAIDLIGIGNVFFKQGRCADAVEYFKRALSVSEAAGDKQGIKDASAVIEKCL